MIQPNTDPMPYAIQYWSTHTAWHRFQGMVLDCIERHSEAKVLDVGGGANPLLSCDDIAQLSADYTILDLSERELAKAPDSYTKIVGDITDPTLLTRVSGGYDVVFTKMLAEHVREPERFHTNIHALLAPGGHALHFFPTMYAAPFIINKLLPESVAGALFRKLKLRENDYQFAKFPAYYKWCFGPVKRQGKRFNRLGYDIELYVGCMGHDYYRRIPGLRQIHRMYSGTKLRHPLSWTTSYAILVLNKP